MQNKKISLDSWKLKDGYYYLSLTLTYLCLLGHETQNTCFDLKKKPDGCENLFFSLMLFNSKTDNTNCVTRLLKIELKVHSIKDKSLWKVIKDSHLLRVFLALKSYVLFAIFTILKTFNLFWPLNHTNECIRKNRTDVQPWLFPYKRLLIFHFFL